MSALTPRYWEVFFEVYEALPRQGPGSRAEAARALALCRDLPAKPTIADVGCGGGGQILHLAELTGGDITAIDNHAPFIVHLGRKIAAHGLAARVRAVVGDMGRLPFAPGSLDLIWSEGALYNLGVAQGLGLWRPFLRPRGCVAFTEAVWLRPDPPPVVRAIWAEEYPQMKDVAANLAIVAAAGYEVLGHFTLAAEAWWDDFYTPMEARIAALTVRHRGDDEALTVLALLQREIDRHREHAGWYGYEFFVARRDGRPA